LSRWARSFFLKKLLERQFFRLSLALCCVKLLLGRSTAIRGAPATATRADLPLLQCDPIG
jgi:hypothetical protein